MLFFPLNVSFEMEPIERTTTSLLSWKQIWKEERFIRWFPMRSFSPVLQTCFALTFKWQDHDDQSRSNEQSTGGVHRGGSLQVCEHSDYGRHNAKYPIRRGC